MADEQQLSDKQQSALMRVMKALTTGPAQVLFYGSALAAIAPLGVDVIGLNCATGPEEMDEHLRYLARHSPVPVSAIPNAGLPEVVDGEMHYYAMEYVQGQTLAALLQEKRRLPWPEVIDIAV